MTKEDVLNRLLEVYKEKSTSETQFAKRIGANQKTINQQFKGERAISLDTILLVVSSFEDISAEWLLRGKGEMYLKEASSADEIEALKAELNMLRGENNVLREQVGLGKRTAGAKTA